MDIWSQGYVTDIPYTAGFYRELAPSWLNFVATTAGCLPRPTDQPFSYIELGCGHGLTTATLAAANPHGDFYGVDFNPTHIDSATRYAAACGIENVTFLERSFGDLLDVDLPSFDFITLHGVYVWISGEMQGAIRDFIRARLKPGGLVYLSYNCLPGWSITAPIQKWMVEMGAVVPGGSLGRGRAFESLKRGHETKTGYFRANTTLGSTIDDLAMRNSSYLVHEYMNENWQLKYCVDVADEMAESKLALVGSAALGDDMFELHMPEAGAKFLRGLPSPRLRQLASDFFTMRRFRKDVFIRGEAYERAATMTRLWRETPVGYMTGAEQIPEKLSFIGGDISFKDASSRLLREVLDEGPQRIVDIEAKVTARLGCPSDVDRLIQLLLAKRILMPFLAPYLAPKPPAVVRTARWRHPVNARIAAVALSSAQDRYLANPLSGNGVQIDPLTSALITALDGSGASVDELAGSVCRMLAEHSITLLSAPESTKDKAEQAERPAAYKGSAPTAADGKVAPDQRAFARAHIEHRDDVLRRLSREGLLDLE